MKVAVVGGGVGGLSAAYQAHCDGHEVQLFEATSKLGGLIETVSCTDGSPAEAGAESSLRSKPEFLELAKELGLESEIISTIPENIGSFIVRDSRLHPIPMGLRLMAPSLFWPFLKSRLLSWSGKLRVLLDLVLPQRKSGVSETEESLAEFVVRRLGREAFDYLAQPMIAGIYGADPQFLSLDATMPMFSRFEKEHGSVIKGLRHLGTEGQATGARYNLFFSLKQGFGQLVEALERILPGGSLLRGARVDSLRQHSDQKSWELEIRGQGTQRFDAVVLALPAPSAGELIAEIDEEAATLLKGILYRPAVTVNLSYDAQEYDSAVPKGYGFIVPAKESRPLLACTFSSYKWPGRRGKNTKQLRTYFGGPDLDWALHASDEDLISISSLQLKELIGLDAEIVESSIHRHPIGLPEYQLGHRQLIQKLRSRIELRSGIALVGNYIDGVGLSDCVRLGRKSIHQLTQDLA